MKVQICHRVQKRFARRIYCTLLQHSNRGHLLTQNSCLSTMHRLYSLILHHACRFNFLSYCMVFIHARVRLHWEYLTGPTIIQTIYYWLQKLRNSLLRAIRYWIPGELRHRHRVKRHSFARKLPLRMIQVIFNTIKHCQSYVLVNHCGRIIIR